MPTILIVDDLSDNIRLLKELIGDIGQVVFANSGAEALLQAELHRPDIILLDVMMGGMDGYETCRRLKAQPETRHIPILFITAAGDECDEEMGLSVGAIDYITKPFRPNVARARVRNHLAAVAVEHAHRQWVADTSHELRTPLTILKAQLEAMTDGILPLNAAGLTTLSDTVAAMECLVDDLHQLACADGGGASFHFASVALGGLLDDLCTGFQPAMREHGLTLELDCAAVPTLHLDRQRMHQVVANLLSNAVRYTDPGGRVRVRLGTTSDQVVLSVDDSAPGVPTASLARLFERFYRVEPSRGRGQGGSGLGLAICQAIVQAHGGQLSAAHGELGGLCVSVTLPLHLAQRAIP